MREREHYYNKAIFRDGVEWLVGDARAVFTYAGTTFDVDCNTPAAHEISRLCSLLDHGFDSSSLTNQFGDFTPHALELIDVFDRYGFLTDASVANPDKLISGTMFWREVDAFSFRTKARLQPVFYEALRSGKARRHHLLRYAQEYFQIVRHGPRIIAGALPHMNDAPSRVLMEQFLASELGHDQLLLSALEAGGVDADLAANALPLPETFAIISALQVFADQEPLTFRASVFLLEESSVEFHRAFVNACKREGLERDFWAPIVRHAEINDDGNHGNISANLLAHVEVVTAEERLVVLKQVNTLIESMVEFERALLQ